MKTISITLAQIYNNFVANIRDILWDVKGEETDVKENLKQFSFVIEAVLTPNYETIRQMFNNELTPLLLGRENMDSLDAGDPEEEAEIRIYDSNEMNKDTLAYVIVDRDIQY